MSRLGGLGRLRILNKYSLLHHRVAYACRGHFGSCGQHLAWVFWLCGWLAALLPDVKNIVCLGIWDIKKDIVGKS